MEKLTKEEVLHVANLGKLELNDEEIENFSYQLKAILNEIEKINEVKTTNNDILIAPHTNSCDVREDTEVVTLNKEDVLKNAPHISNGFITVRGVFDE